MSVNLTLWVIIDTTPWLDKLVTLNQEPTNRKRKSAKDFLDKDYGSDFASLFDICLDITQLSNKDMICLTQFNSFFDRERCRKISYLNG